MKIKKETQEFLRYAIVCHPWLLIYIATVVTVVLALQIAGVR